MKFRSTKRQGEWAEYLLIVKLIELGLNPLRPLLSGLAYDVGAENPRNRGFKRVQVKSASFKDPYGFYAINCHRTTSPGLRRRYRKTEIDVFAIYLIPENTWYIIPASIACKSLDIRLHPQGRGIGAKAEKYREAWHLMF
jgi:hypothetical protein